MSNSMIVGLFTYTENAATHLGVRDRVGRFEAVLLRFARIVQSRQASLATGNPCQGVFVVPEYFFSERGKKPMDQVKKMFVQQSVLAISRKYPNILIVPGSIYQYRQIDSHAVRMKWMDDLYETVKDTARRQAESKVAKTSRDLLLSDNAAVGFKTGAVKPTGDRYVPALDKVAESLYSGHRPKRVFNNTYLILNGEYHLQYEKTADFLEAKNRPTKEQIFIPGHSIGARTINGKEYQLSFGMEICFDHCVGILKKRNLSNIDFHIVISDYTSTASRNFAAREGGYVLHASTNYQSTGIWYVSANGAPYNMTTDTRYWICTDSFFQNSHLDTYEIPVPPA